ncbi:MAG: MFS transporter [Actinomycetes bacterium]
MTNWRLRCALAVLCSAQLLIVLDACSLSVALPSIQRDLGISDIDRVWITNAMTLAWGASLLLGGRIADISGRRRALHIGLLGFALSSLVAGTAQNELALIIGRVLQGVSAGLLTPAALALLSVLFIEPHARARALGIYGAVAAAGSMVGLVLGGALTEYASWRWCLLANVPLALVLAALSAKFLTESRSSGKTLYDHYGAATGTIGVALLALGVSQVGRSDSGAHPALVWLALISAVGFLIAFWYIEKRCKHPLLPPEIILDRGRGAALLTVFVLSLGVLPILLLTLFMQRVLLYSALATGVALVPVSVGIVISSAAAGELMQRMGPGRLAVSGLACAALGFVLLARLTVSSSYLPDIFPAEVLISAGVGLALVPLCSAALLGIASDDVGVGSAAFLTTQQVGGCIGAALLNAVATGAAAMWLSQSAEPHSAATVMYAAAHGYDLAFIVGAGMACIAGVIAFVRLRPLDSAWTSTLATEVLI